jgi:rhodanese-related sulfurtransferase
MVGLAYATAAAENRDMKLLPRWFRRSPTSPAWIDAPTLATRLDTTPAPLVLDVRGPDEFSGPLGHIAGATNIPLNQLPAQLPGLARGARPVVVVCKTDRRSSMAAHQLQEAGVPSVSVLRGGMEQWRALGLPVS